jgi:hypothetical protein
MKQNNLDTTYTGGCHCGGIRFRAIVTEAKAIDVNIRCLDGNVLSDFAIEYFDGENWEENIEKIRSQ